MSERASNYGDFFIVVIAVGGIMFGIGEHYERSKRVDYECEPGAAVSHRDGDKLRCFYSNNYQAMRTMHERPPRIARPTKA